MPVDSKRSQFGNCDTPPFDRRSQNQGVATDLVISKQLTSSSNSRTPSRSVGTEPMKPTVQDIALVIWAITDFTKHRNEHALDICNFLKLRDGKAGDEENMPNGRFSLDSVIIN